MATAGHATCNKCPFKQACENCFLELLVYVPEHYSIEEYIQITKPFLSSMLVAITRQKETNTYTLEAADKNMLKDVKFELTYLCKHNLQNKEQVNQLKYEQKDENTQNKLSLKAVVYKKPLTNQQVRVTPESINIFF
jgi:hypothetical protein